MITALITATATVAGVLLTQWHARYMRRWDQHDERRVEQRESLVEVLATGRELAASREAVMMVAGMSSNTVEFGNSSVVDAHGPLVKPHHRALLTARLLVRDPAGPRARHAHVAGGGEAAEQLPPLLDNAKAHGRADVEVLR